MTQGYLATWFDQAIEMGTKIIQSLSLIKNNKLWEGFFRHKLVIICSVLAAIVIPWSLIQFIQSTFTSPDVTSQSLGFQADIKKSVEFSSLFKGGNKYIVMILIQMLVLHISNRTLEHLSGVKIGLSAKMLITSQWRVIVVSIRNWIVELLLGILISIAIGMIGLKFMEDFLKFLLGAYFVGFIFIDNFNHMFGMKVEESALVVRKYAGAALIVGLFTKILFLMPFAGALIASIVCTVGATWFMFEHEGYRIHEGQLKYS